MRKMLRKKTKIPPLLCDLCQNTKPLTYCCNILPFKIHTYCDGLSYQAFSLDRCYTCMKNQTVSDGEK